MSLGHTTTFFAGFARTDLERDRRPALGGSRSGADDSTRGRFAAAARGVSLQIPVTSRANDSWMLPESSDDVSSTSPTTCRSAVRRGGTATQGRWSGGCRLCNQARVVPRHAGAGIAVRCGECGRQDLWGRIRIPPPSEKSGLSQVVEVTPAERWFLGGLYDRADTSVEGRPSAARDRLNRGSGTEGQPLYDRDFGVVHRLSMESAFEQAEQDVASRANVPRGFPCRSFPSPAATPAHRRSILAAAEKINDF